MIRVLGHDKIKFFLKKAMLLLQNTWDKVFKNGPSEIFGRQPLKKLKGYGLREADHTPSNFLKAVFHKFYLVHS